MREIAHIPVLLEETIEFLAPRGKGETMVDLTMGEAGHSYAFLSRFSDLSVVGVDADSAIQWVARERLAEFGNRVQFFNAWSQDFLASYPASLKKPDTILADLGISMYHYRSSGRGFSFSADEALDMRLDASRGMSAADILARMSEGEIADILYNNGGERYSRRIARLIVQERRKAAITTSAALADLIERAVPASYRHGPRHGRLHPATRSFMALRIAVNGELERLPELLENALEVLAPGGRLGIITFHALEDRIVKNFFRMKNRACTCPPEVPVCQCGGKRKVNILTRKGVTASEAEVKENPPSRSARLRVAEKIKEINV